jgi:glycopeptide antibiotics resistance protein
LDLSTVNLIPFAGEIHRTVEALPRASALIYSAGNVLFFTSLSLMLWGLLGDKIKSRAGELLLLIGVPFTVSIMCEISEYLTHHGNADIDDVMLNTLGAAIGCFAAKIIKKSVLED